MSSKTKTTATKKEATPALVPKLRFPEFRGAEGWVCRQLEAALSSISNGLVLEQSSDASGFRVTRIETISAGAIDLEKVGLVKTSQDISAYKLRVGDILLSNINSVAHIGKSVFVDRDYDLYHGMNLLRLGVNRTKHDPQFIYYLINTDGIRASLRERANKAVNQASINQTELGRTAVALPLKPEQQKIAECLSSVDELMAAQARKVDALKTHKKGLMQQLFPREGETQPRLRFPEFQKAGEWARMSIQEMIDKRFIIGHLDGNHGELYPKAEEFSQNKEGIPYISANDFMNGSVEFSKCKRLPIERARLFKKGVAKDGDILFAHNATVGPVAKLNTAEEFVILSTTATYFRCNNKHLSNDFLQSALSSPDFVAQYSRVMSQSTRNQVPITTQRKLELHLPNPPEQERIAACLSSLNALITAETQKHEALKTHNKGLLQQLFPSPTISTS